MQKKKIISAPNSKMIIFKGSFQEDHIDILEPKVDFEVISNTNCTKVIYIKNLGRVLKVSTECEKNSDEMYPLQNEWFMLEYIRELKDIKGIKHIQLPIVLGGWEDTDDGKIYPCIHYKYSDKGDAFDMLHDYDNGIISKKPMKTMVKRVVRQMLEGVSFLHERDILHGDIKLENLLIVSGSHKRPKKLQIKIIDFENAQKVKKNECFNSKYQFGTTEYMAPEADKDGIYSHKSDMFSVGCSIYMLHTKETCPAYRSGSPSIARIKMELEEPKHNKTRRDQFYSNLILELVDISPSQRPTAKQSLNLLKKAK